VSIDEQDEAIARLVKQRSEARKRKALLENELRTAGRSLWEIGSALKSIKAEGSFQETPEYILPEIEKAPKICSLDRIKSMLQDLQETQKLLAQFDRGLSELGIV
jgi:hypothetical protein